MSYKPYFQLSIVRKYLICEAAYIPSNRYACWCMAINVNKYFGEQVRKERKKQGLSQLKLAELSMIDLSTINRVERGEANITLRNTFKIAKGLKVKLTNLIGI